MSVAGRGRGQIAATMSGISSLSAIIRGRAPIAALLSGTSSMIAVVRGVGRISAIMSGTSTFLVTYTQRITKTLGGKIANAFRI
jgi:hypothetical protein